MPKKAPLVPEKLRRRPEKPLPWEQGKCQGPLHKDRSRPLLDGGLWLYQDQQQPESRYPDQHWRKISLCHGCLLALLDDELPDARFRLLTPPPWAGQTQNLTEEWSYA